MHEIGHNIGLGHSGETATYDDQSGMVSVPMHHISIDVKWVPKLKRYIPLLNNIKTDGIQLWSE